MIPTLNEGEYLQSTLDHIRANPTPHEVIVVDGGSTDSTVAIASAAKVRVIHAPACRSIQMNTGAEKAGGVIILFLHADTLLHPTSLHEMEQALKNPDVVGGGFARKFDSDSIFLKTTCALATLRCLLFGWFLGDQGIFVRSTVFHDLGGFRNMKSFEDADFSYRMGKVGKTVVLWPPVISSGRRFAARGPVRTTLSDLGLTIRYLLVRENHSAR